MALKSPRRSDERDYWFHFGRNGDDDHTYFGRQAMSGQKGEFPQRVIVERTVISGMIVGIYLKALEIRPSFGMPEEYLSLSEHAALIEQARREARAEMAKEVYKDLLNRPVDGWQAALMWLHLEIESAKASEGQR